MAELLPNEADQNFLYQLICSQLENDGYIKSAKCLQVELNSLDTSAAPGDKLEKLVNMCIQIKKHIDVHFKHSFKRKRVGEKDMGPDSTNERVDHKLLRLTSLSGHNHSEDVDVDTPMVEESQTIETFDATSSSEVGTTMDSSSRDVESQSTTSFSKLTNSPRLNLSQRLSSSPTGTTTSPKSTTSPKEGHYSPKNQLSPNSSLGIETVQSPGAVKETSPRTGTIPPSHHTSPIGEGVDKSLKMLSTISPKDSNDSLKMISVSASAPGIDMDTCRRQLLQHQLILQQIQLQHMHNNTIDEQAKKLSDYMLKCYKTDLSMAPSNGSSNNGILSSIGQTIGSLPSPTMTDLKPPFSRSPSKFTTAGFQNPTSSDSGLLGNPVNLLNSTQTMMTSSQSMMTPTQALLTPTPALLTPTQTPNKAENLSPSFDPKKDWNLELQQKLQGTKIAKTAAESQAEFDRKRFPCRYCGRRFTQQSALQVHERTHTGEKPYHCHFCEKAFTQISNLKCHERLHTGEKPYRCHLCGKRFTQSASLRCHMRSHTGERPYLCKYCNKRFTQPASLQHHIRIHTGEKPYKCEHCAKCFTQPSSLVVHRRLHTGERPFVCQVCGKSYTQAMPLKEHMRTHHQMDKSGSPLSFSLGQPFSLQMNQLQSSLTANIGSLPFILSNKFMPDLGATTLPTQDTVPASSMSQLLFNRQNTAFQSVYPSLNKDANKDQPKE